MNKDLPTSVTTADDFTLLPGVGSAIRRLNEAGHKVAVVTNQACVGRGALSPQGLEKIHQKMTDLLSLDGAFLDKIYVCPDTTIAPNHRRKPAPGMILEALSDFGFPPEQTLMVGDALRDLQAAHAAGCPALLVKTGKGQETLKEISSLEHPVPVANTLPDAVEMILQKSYWTETLRDSFGFCAPMKRHFQI